MIASIKIRSVEYVTNEIAHTSVGYKTARLQVAEEET